MSIIILSGVLLGGLVLGMLAIPIVLYMLCLVAVIIIGITHPSKLEYIAYHINKPLNNSANKSNTTSDSTEKRWPLKYFKYFLYGYLITWYVFRMQIKELVRIGNAGAGILKGSIHRRIILLRIIAFVSFTILIIYGLAVMYGLSFNPSITVYVVNTFTLVAIVSLTMLALTGLSLILFMEQDQAENCDQCTETSKYPIAPCGPNPSVASHNTRSNKRVLVGDYKEDSH